MCIFRNYSKLFQNIDECKIMSSSDYNIEYIGMFYKGRLHGYGCILNYKNGTAKFGIFKNGYLYKNLHNKFRDIYTKIGKDSKIISSRFFGCGTFIGELVSIAASEENPELRKDRYGIIILKNGMYVGCFPPGFFFTRCDGCFYDLNGQVHNGTFDIDIEDKQRIGDDLLGEYAPCY